jgi:hypothetical protein
MSPYVVGRFNERVRRIETARILKGIRANCATDVMLKTSMATPRLLLEVLICELCPLPQLRAAISAVTIFPALLHSAPPHVAPTFFHLGVQMKLKQTLNLAAMLRCLADVVLVAFAQSARRRKIVINKTDISLGEVKKGSSANLRFLQK